MNEIWLCIFGTKLLGIPCWVFCLLADLEMFLLVVSYGILKCRDLNKTYWTNIYQKYCTRKGNARVGIHPRWYPIPDTFRWWVSVVVSGDGQSFSEQLYGGGETTSGFPGVWNTSVAGTKIMVINGDLLNLMIGKSEALTLDIWILGS